jgi:hypothetical protein
MDTFGFTPDAGKRIQQTGRRLLAQERNRAQSPGPSRRILRRAIKNPVRVSGAGIATGLGYTVYPGFTQSFNAATGVWTDQAACYMIESNGAALIPDRYTGTLVGVYNAQGIYALALPGGSGAGASVNLVTGACPLFTTISGTQVQTGVVVEYTPATLPAGSLLGAVSCANNPSSCQCILTTCCPNSLPTMLCATVVQTGGPVCAGVNGTIDLIWIDAFGEWLFWDSDSGALGDFALLCDRAQGWLLDTTASECGVQDFRPDSVTCNPFRVHFSGVTLQQEAGFDQCLCIGSVWDITITAGPCPGWAAPYTCGHCAVSPRAWTFSMGGPGNGTCTGCGNWAGVIALDSYHGGCTWSGGLNSGMNCGGTLGTGGVTLTLVGSTWTLQFFDSTGALWARYILADASWNCFGPNVMTANFIGGQCAGPPPSVTLTAPP